MELFPDVDMDGLGDGLTPLDNTMSTASGTYVFEGVPAGHYVVRGQNLTMFGFGFAPQNVGNNQGCPIVALAWTTRLLQGRSAQRPP